MFGDLERYLSLNFLSLKVWRRVLDGEERWVVTLSTRDHETRFGDGADISTAIKQARAEWSERALMQWHLRRRGLRPRDASEMLDADDAKKESA